MNTNILILLLANSPAGLTGNGWTKIKSFVAKYGWEDMDGLAKTLFRLYKRNCDDKNLRFSICGFVTIYEMLKDVPSTSDEDDDVAEEIESVRLCLYRYELKKLLRWMGDLMKLKRTDASARETLKGAKFYRLLRFWADSYELFSPEIKAAFLCLTMDYAMVVERNAPNNIDWRFILAFFESKKMKQMARALVEQFPNCQRKADEYWDFECDINMPNPTVCDFLSELI